MKVGKRYDRPKSSGLLLPYEATYLILTMHFSLTYSQMKQFAFGRLLSGFHCAVCTLVCTSTLTGAMKSFTFFSFLFVSFALAAQPDNLVPNPGFEERDECIFNDALLVDAPPWFSPTGGTPDVFHTCTVVNEEPCPWPLETYLDQWYFGIPTNVTGCQVPHSGEGYAGQILYHPGVSPYFDAHEYLAVELLEPLQVDEDYLVRYYISRADRTRYAVWAFHVLFLQEPEYLLWENPSYLDLEGYWSYPEGQFVTDTEGWTEISFVYTAQGGERYLYIGNFQPPGEMDLLLDFPNWLDPGDLWPSYYYVDDVYVGQIGLNVHESTEIKNKLLLSNFVTTELSLTKVKNCDWQILNTSGQIVLEGKLNNSAIDISSLPIGMYILSVRENGNFQKEKFVKR